MLLTAIHLLFGAALANSPDRKELTGNLGVLNVFTCWSTWVFRAVEHKTCAPIFRTYVLALN